MEITFHHLLILTLFWSFCFHLNTGTVRSQCLKDQESLLLQFKKTVTYGHSSKLSSWDSSTDCCSWLGVTYDNGGHVTRLDLNNEFLSGPISSINWPGFSKLESIALSNNSLSGTIPASLFSIPSLLGIYLNQNDFTGKLNGPSRKSSSSALESLDLRENKLVGPFPNFVFRLRSLRSLELSSNYFSGPVKLSSFQQLENLSALDLSHNRLWIDETGVDATSLPKIHTIFLASCNLARFPAFLKEQSGLWDLDLSNNKIGEEIPDWIWSIEYLRRLNVSHNSLSSFREPSQGYPFILDALDLKNNKLQGELPKAPRPVIYLDFSGNNFSSVIPDDYGSNLKRAHWVYLANNNLHGSIPESFCNVTSLEVLDLSNNSLSGTVPQCLYKMASLRELDLGGNQFNGHD